jgi:hypothetical protein
MAEMHEYEAPKLLREAQILELIGVAQQLGRSGCNASRGLLIGWLFGGHVDFLPSERGVTKPAL